MAGMALDRLDQIGNQVIAPLELHVDLALGVVDLIPPSREPVVDEHRDDQHHDDHDRENDEGGGHGQSFTARRDHGSNPPEPQSST
jgi:hypothetical protein